MGMSELKLVLQLYELGNQIITAETTQSVVESAARGLAQVFQADFAAIFLTGLQGKLALDFGLAANDTDLESAWRTACQTGGQPLQIPDDHIFIDGHEAGNADQLPAFWSELGVEAYTGLPLGSPEEQTGLVCLGFLRAHPFTEESSAGLRQFSAQVGAAIERTRMLIKTRQREMDLSELAEMARMMISTLDIEELLLRIATRLAVVTGMDSCAISAFEPDPDRVQLLAHYNWSGVPDTAGESEIYLLKDYPATARVLRNGEPLVLRVNDPGADPAEVELMRMWEYQVLVMLPLEVRGRSVGLVELYSEQDKPGFSSEELDRLMAFAEQVALAISNARLYAREQRTRLAAETIRHATLALSATLELNQVLDLILEQLQQVVHFDSASLMLLEENQLRVLAVHGHPNPEAALQVRFNVEEDDLAQEVVAKKDTIILGDAREDRRFRLRGEATYVRGWMGVPLLAAGRVIGLLTLDDREPHAYNADDANLAMAFANQASVAVANARLYQSEREQRTLAEALREISLVLSSSLEMGAILETLLEQIERVIPYDSACVLLQEKDEARAAAHRGFESFGTAQLIEDLVLPVNKTANLLHMVKTRRPFYIADVNNYPGWVTTETSWHTGSWLGAPLVAHDRLLGFLTLDKVEHGHYTALHAARLEALAGHAAIALLNALTFGEVEQASITDFVTGSFNHRYFHQQLRQEIDRSRRLGQPLSLLMLDIDNFKVVNDNHGHQVGDLILHSLAERLRGELRVVDVLARYGGEEFTIILPGTTVESVVPVAEKLRRAVAAQDFQVNGLEIPVTVSIGGAAYPDHASSARELVECADQAMYQAKEDGRDCVRLADGEPD